MNVPRSSPALDPSYPKYPTIVHALERAAELGPERPGIACQDITLSFRQYAHVVGALARTLAGFDVAHQRVAFMMGNSLEAAVGLLAGMAARAQVAPLNPAYTDAELEPLLQDVEAQLLVCDRASAARGGEFSARLGIKHLLVLGPDGVTLGALLSTAGAPLPLPEPGDAAAMFFTGGTTGLPKGAMHDHSNLMAYCYATAALWPFPPDRERILNVAPLFHIWGFCFTLVFPMYVRAFMDLVPAYKPAVVLEQFQKQRISVFAGGPAALYMGLRANENFGRTDFSSLKICLSGGAACPEELLTSWEAATGSPIIEGWGMSEGAPINLNPLHGVRKSRSTGIVPPDTEVQVVDLETGRQVMPAGERGEVRVRGPQFTKGYRNRPEENRQAIREGWLYTGDIGYFDEDGYLFLVDRKKEMIIVGGYNVYPREIDELLFAHPLVLEAATVGVPDSFSGEAVKAFVVLKPGAALDAAQLTEYCRASLVKYKVPTRIEWVEALPRTAVGKINKLALKQRA